MNVLEKILEEIKQPTNYTIMCGKHFTTIDRVEEIIRSHMDDGKDINVNNADAPYITLALNEERVAEVYDDTYDVTVHCESEEEQERVVGILEHYQDWIPVEERLPEDGTYLCTLDGELCGIDEPFTGMCGIENGKWDEEGCVIAWQPLPKPYRPDPCHGCFGAANNDCRNCDKI